MKVSLGNGCASSDIKVFPASWQRNNASIKKPWYIYYRFYDPFFVEEYRYGYLVYIKGMNEYKTLEARQRLTEAFIANEWKKLKERGYNPITGVYQEPEQKIDYIISPELEFCPAFQKAFERLEGVKEWLDDIKSALKYVTIAAEQLRLDKIQIKNVKRRHVIMVLDQLKRTKATWTEATYNRYLKNIRTLFKELVRVEAIEYNPAGELENKRTIKKVKKVLNPEERKAIDELLRKENYTFWRFIHIFFHSGSRTTEIMGVKKEDVDLKKQMVTYTIKKGKVTRQAPRPIKNSVLYLWEQLMIEAKAGQFLFGEGLKPGDKPIRVDQIRHRWRLWVQKKMKIDCTWYSLKHLNTDEMEAMYGTDVAARLNEHGADMVRKHYAVNHIAREHEVIKNAVNTFA